MLFGLVGMLVCNGGYDEPRWDTGGWDEEPWWDSGEPWEECAAWMDIEPDLIDFGAVVGEAAPKELVVYNGGDCDLEIWGLEIWGDDAEAFTLELPEEPIVPPGGQASLRVRFIGEAVGAYEAQLLVDTNDPYTPQQVVELRAERAEAAALMSLEPTSLDFGEVPLGCAAEASAQIANAGSATLGLSYVGLFDVSGDFALLGAAPAEVAAQSAEVLTLRYTPAGAVEGETYLLAVGDGRPREALLSLRGVGLAGAEALLEATGDGETLRFELPSQPYALSLVVELDGARQEAGWSYADADNAIAFTEAPASNAAIAVRYTEQLPCE